MLDLLVKGLGLAGPRRGFGCFITPARGVLSHVNPITFSLNQSQEESYATC